MALYAGVSKEEITGATLLREELGFDSLVILMLLITLAESLGRNVFVLSFDLARLECVDDLVAVFPAPYPVLGDSQPAYCLH